MEIGSEGSGKLITILRRNGHKYSTETSVTIVDGPPGIGCTAISSITGSSAALLAAEPTQSGMEDFMRAAELCEHFKIPVMVCINKCDLNEKITNKIEEFSCEHGYKVVGKIPYDDTVMKSINALKPITYYEESAANKAIRQMWHTMLNYIIKLNIY
jgi:MinD superfamily P-loop ATPase